MQRREDGIRRTRDDGAASDNLFRRRVAPSLPKSGKCKWKAIRGHDREGPLEASPASLPLVKPINRDDAAALGERIAERRLIGDALCARVDHPVCDGPILNPYWDEPPMKQTEVALLILRVVANGQHVNARCNVVARQALRERTRRSEHARDFPHGSPD